MINLVLHCIFAFLILLLWHPLVPWYSTIALSMSIHIVFLTTHIVAILIKWSYLVIVWLPGSLPLVTSFCTFILWILIRPHKYQDFIEQLHVHVQLLDYFNQLLVIEEIYLFFGWSSLDLSRSFRPLMI